MGLQGTDVLPQHGQTKSSKGRAFAIKVQAESL
jgi:hypothetical protein